MSLDFGFLGPPDSDSSDDDIFTGAVVDQSEHSIRDSSSQSQFSYQRLESPRKKQYHQVRS